MKKSVYIFVLVISFLSTCFMLFKIFDCVTNSKAIWCDFIAMIGGGIFCSTIVSWFVETQNKSKEKRDKDQQRKFILASAKNKFIRLIGRELFEFSFYYSAYLSDCPAEWVREDVGCSKVGGKLLWLIEKFESDEEEELKLHTITPQTIKKDEAKKKCVVTQNKSYYKSLHQALLELATYFNTYLIAGVLSEEQVEKLNELIGMIDDILMFEPEFGLGDGTILEFKKLLFEKIEYFLPVLEIFDTDTMHIQYKNVFNQ